jgi:putative transcriptional regulator
LSKPEKRLGQRIVESLKEANAWAQGKDVPGMRVNIPEAYDTRKIRKRMKLSQAQFAKRFGFSLDSIQNWEQGRRIPDGAARTLLMVISQEPKAVERALRAAG